MDVRDECRLHKSPFADQDPRSRTSENLVTWSYARGRDGGAREETSERSGTGCSSHGATVGQTATQISSGSRTHCGSNNAQSSDEIPGRNAASTMTAMQRQ